MLLKKVEELLKSLEFCLSLGEFCSVCPSCDGCRHEGGHRKPCDLKIVLDEVQTKLQKGV